MCIRDRLHIAVPSVLQQSTVSIGMMIVQAVVNPFGTQALAGYATTMRVENVFSLILSLIHISFLELDLLGLLSCVSVLGTLVAVQAGQSLSADGVGRDHALDTVSYTHLDVYKRQVLRQQDGGGSPRQAHSLF